LEKEKTRELRRCDAVPLGLDSLFGVLRTCNYEIHVHDGSRPITATDNAQKAKSFVVPLDRSRNEGKSERMRTASRARGEIDKWLRASGGY